MSKWLVRPAAVVAVHEPLDYDLELCRRLVLLTPQALALERTEPPLSMLFLHLIQRLMSWITRLSSSRETYSSELKTLPWSPFMTGIAPCVANTSLAQAT